MLVSLGRRLSASTKKWLSGWKLLSNYFQNVLQTRAVFDRNLSGWGLVLLLGLERRLSNYELVNKIAWYLV